MANEDEDLALALALSLEDQDSSGPTSAEAVQSAQPRAATTVRKPVIVESKENHSGTTQKAAIVERKGADDPFGAPVEFEKYDLHNDTNNIDNSLSVQTNVYDHISVMKAGDEDGHSNNYASYDTLEPIGTAQQYAQTTPQNPTSDTNAYDVQANLVSEQKAVIDDTVRETEPQATGQLDRALAWLDSQLKPSTASPPVLALSDDDRLFRSELVVDERFYRKDISFTTTFECRAPPGQLPIDMPTHWERNIVVYSEKAKNAIADRMSSLSAAGVRGSVNVTERRIQEWNHEYQGCFEYVPCRPHEEKWRIKRLQTIMTDFVDFAQEVAEHIVSELHVPAADKRLPPADLGGIAGGEKFVFGNTLFKFAHDAHGIFKSDQYAAKAASNEIRAMNALTQAQVSHLHMPLTALYHVQGYCIIATALAPISKETLVLGSDDAGVTVKSDSPAISSLFEQLSKALNLKSHIVVDSSGTEHKVSVAGDVEGHISTGDGRYYICDLARLLPCSPPRRWNHPLVRSDHLHRVLRPEFMTRYTPHPLSSDAFSQWGRHKAAEHCRDVMQAMAYMHSHVIPAVAEHLDHALGRERDDEDGRARRKLLPSVPDIAVSELGKDTHKGDVIRIIFHSYGVNMREAGAVYQHLQTKEAAQALCEDVSARCCKSIVRRFLRSLPAALTTAQRQQAATVGISRLLRLLCGANDDVDSDHFWKVVLSSLADFHFCGSAQVSSGTPVKRIGIDIVTYVRPLVAGLTDMSEILPSSLACLRSIASALSLKDLCDLDASDLTEAVQATLFSLLAFEDANASKASMNQDENKESAAAEAESAEALKEEEEEEIALPPLVPAVKRKVMQVPALLSFSENRERLESSLRLREVTAGRHSVRLVWMLVNLLNLYESQRLNSPEKEVVEEAKKNALKTVEHLLEIADNTTHPDAIFKCIFKAAEHNERVGEHDAAEVYYQRLLSESERLFGDHPNTANALTCLATCLERRGDVRGKMRLLKQSLSMQRRLKNVPPRDIGGVLNNMAVAHNKLNEYPEMLKLADEALDMMVKSCGWKDPETLVVMHTKMMALSALGRVRESLALGEQHLKLTVELHGPESLEAAKAYNSFGIRVGDMGNIRRQRELYMKALGILRLRNAGKGVNPSSDSQLVTVLTNLTNCHRKLGENQEAYVSAQEAYDVARLIYGEEHRTTLFCWSDLGRTYMELEQYEKQVDIMERALRKQIALLGEDCDEVAETLQYLGCGYGYLHMKEIEESYIRRAYNIKMKVLGPDHPNTDVCKMNLANVLGYLNRHEEKRQMLEEVLKNDIARTGKMTPQTATAMTNLGICCAQMNDLQNASRYLGEAHLISSQTLGPGHPTTQFILRMVARFLTPAAQNT